MNNNSNSKKLKLKTDKKKREANSLDKLFKTIPDLKTAREHNEIGLYAFLNAYKNRSKQPVKIKRKSHSHYWQKQPQLKDMEKYKNLGLILGYDPNNTGQHLACIDIDGLKKKPIFKEDSKKNDQDYWYDWDYHKKSCNLLYNVLKDIDIDLIPLRTWSGGYHLYYISKEEVITGDLDILEFIRYPDDWSITELQGKGITEVTDTIEVIAKPNQKVFMTYPAKWREWHLNPETDKTLMREGSYEFLNPPEKNLIRKLQPVKNISKALLNVFTKHSFVYDKKAHQKHKKRMIEEDTPILRRINHEQTSNSSEITRELIDNVMKCYRTGNMDLFAYPLIGNLIRNGWSKAKVKELFKSLPITQDMKKINTLIERDFQQPITKLAGWTSLESAIKQYHKLNEDIPATLRYFSQFKTNIKNDKIFVFNDKYSLEIRKKGYRWITTKTQEGLTALIKGKPLIETDFKRDENLVDALLKKDSEIVENDIRDFITSIGVKLEDSVKKYDDNDTENLATEEWTPPKSIKYNPEDKNNKQKLEELKKEVIEHYDSNYLDYVAEQSHALILNEEPNIIKDILLAFATIRGSKSVINECHGHPDSGKSYRHKISLKYFIPEEHIIKTNSQTEAAFRNNCINNPYYYHRKIIDSGDLGDKDTLNRMDEVLDILKILITEKEFTHVKTKDDKERTPMSITIKAILQLVYQTVEDSDKETSQRSSRTFLTTPALNNQKEKIKFAYRSTRKPYKEHEKFQQTINNLDKFKIYFNYLVREFENDKLLGTKSPHEIINPFHEHTFLKITELSITETRQLDIISHMFESYCIFNHERCFQITTDDMTYLIPKIEDVQKFIDIVYSDVGLKTYERNLLLFFKEHLETLPKKERTSHEEGDTEEITAESLYNKTEEFIRDSHDHLHATTVEKKAVNNLMTEYGLADRLEGTLDDNTKRDKYFFQVTTIRKRFKNMKVIKDIHNLSRSLNDLATRGFIDKLEQKKGRGNIYYLNTETIKTIKETHRLNNEDIQEAIQQIETLNQNTTYTENLLNKKQLETLKNNYNIKTLNKTKKIL